jgi:hypothetical protein
VIPLRLRVSDPVCRACDNALQTMLERADELAGESAGITGGKRNSA